MMRRFASVMVAVVVSTQWTVGTPPAEMHAHDSAAEADEQSLRGDLVNYAEITGVTVAQAEERFRATDDLRPAFRELEAGLSERFAGGWIEHEPAFRVIVRFVGKQPLDSRTQAVLDQPSTARSMQPDDAALRRVEIRFDASHTLADLRAGMDRLRGDIGRRHPDTGVWIDVRSGAIALDGPTPIGETELAELSAIARAPVRWQFAPEPQPGHLRGGHPISAEGGVCTTAFSVRDAITGETGIMTAGHCGFPGLTGGENATYREDADTTHTVTLKGRRWDINQDFEWFSSAWIEQPSFWSGVGYRNVTGTQPRLEMPGEFVCHYGITTGYSCGWVETIHFAPPNNYCNGMACDDVWGKVSASGADLRCWPGDSGGPLFNQGVAWGVYSGQSSNGPNYGQCFYVIFMTIGGLLWDGVNTRVLIAP